MDIIFTNCLNNFGCTPSTGEAQGKAPKASQKYLLTFTKAVTPSGEQRSGNFCALLHRWEVYPFVRFHYDDFDSCVNYRNLFISPIFHVLASLFSLLFHRSLVWHLKLWTSKVHFIFQILYLMTTENENATRAVVLCVSK